MNSTTLYIEILFARFNKILLLLISTEVIVIVDYFDCFESSKICLSDIDKFYQSKDFDFEVKKNRAI